MEFQYWLTVILTLLILFGMLGYVALKCLDMLRTRFKLRRAEKEDNDKIDQC